MRRALSAAGEGLTEPRIDSIESSSCDHNIYRTFTSTSEPFLKWSIGC